MSKILILDNLEEIKNPFEGYVDVTENIRMAKSQGFERFRKLLLAHAHEVDLDEAIREYVRLFFRQCPEISLFAFIEKCPFSQFLASNLDTQKQNVQEKTGGKGTNKEKCTNIRQSAKEMCPAHCLYGLRIGNKKCYSGGYCPNYNKPYFNKFLKEKSND